MRRRAVAVLVLLLATGCRAEAQHRVAVPRLSASPLATSVAAATACPAATPRHLPDGAGTVLDAFVCRSETRDLPGAGTWDFMTVRRVNSGLERLLDAYAEPDRRPPHDASCPLVLLPALVVDLHTLTGVVAVRAPRDVCGQPTRASREAYEALGTTLVWSRKVRQLVSPEAIASGCSDAYKDMLVEEESDGSTPQPSGLPRPVQAPVTVCRYLVQRDAQGDRVGHLVDSRRLTSADVRVLDAELAHATADPSCTRHGHERFALLQDAQGLGTVVALDGCAVQQGSDWWRATDATRSLLSR